MTVGERINELRNEKGMSLRELSEILGISAPTLQRYENGVIKNIGPEMISKIAQALSTTAGWLLGEHEQQDTSSTKVALSQTEHALLDIYRKFTPDEKTIIRSMILTINDLKIKNIKTKHSLNLAEDFIRSTEYCSEYEDIVIEEREKDEAYNADNEDQ